MSVSQAITKNDLINVLEEVVNIEILPNTTMLKTVQYTATIPWYSTSNPFGDVYTDIHIDGWTPINLSYLVSGSLSSFVFASQVEFKENNGVMCAHGYFRMTGQTPSSTTQNAVIWTVTYIRNAHMVAPMADYIVEQGTNANGTYRKWNSGFAECWGSASISSGGYTGKWTFPCAFVDKSKIVVHMTPVDSTSTAWNVNYGATTTTQADIGRTPSSATNVYYMSAIGTWK